MAFAKFERPVTDAAGNVVANVQVSVRRETTGAPLAVLYQDAAGTTPLSNPATFPEGIIRFYTAGTLGGLRLDVVAPGYSATYRNEACGTGGQVDADALFAAAVPPGGATGQVLAKASGTDNDVEWVEQSGGLGGTTGSNDERVLRSNGGGGSTVQASSVRLTDQGIIMGASLVSFQLSIVDDGVATVDLTQVGANIGGYTTILYTNLNTVNEVGYFAARPSAASPHCSNINIANVTALDFTTGVALTGTTGTDGKKTISAHTDGLLYIENREGSTKFLRMTVLGL